MDISDSKVKIGKMHDFIYLIERYYSKRDLVVVSRIMHIKHHHQIIPLIVKFNYRPDGWFCHTIIGEICMNFIKLDFELGEMKLKNEIDRHRKYQRKDSIIITTTSETSIKK
jgi:hypothetical protein